MAQHYAALVEQHRNAIQQRDELAAPVQQAGQPLQFALPAAPTLLDARSAAHYLSTVEATRITSPRQLERERAAEVEEAMMQEAAEMDVEQHEPTPRGPEAASGGSQTATSQDDATAAPTTIRLGADQPSTIRRRCRRLNVR